MADLHDLRSAYTRRDPGAERSVARSLARSAMALHRTSCSASWPSTRGIEASSVARNRSCDAPRLIADSLDHDPLGAAQRLTGTGSPTDCAAIRVPRARRRPARCRRRVHVLADATRARDARSRADDGARRSLVARHTDREWRRQARRHVARCSSKGSWRTTTVGSWRARRTIRTSSACSHVEARLVGSAEVAVLAARCAARPGRRHPVRDRWRAVRATRARPAARAAEINGRGTAKLTKWHGAAHPTSADPRTNVTGRSRTGAPLARDRPPCARPPGWSRI